MQNNISQTTEKYLIKVAQKVNNEMPTNPQHQHALRRSLLDCGHYNDGIFSRYFFRFMMYKKELIKAIATSTGIVVVIMIVVPTAIGYTQNGPFTKKPKYVAQVKTIDLPEEYLQELYKYGYLRFSHKDENGNNIYYAEAKKGVIEVKDESPYKIDLVVAN